MKWLPVVVEHRAVRRPLALALLAWAVSAGPQAASAAVRSWASPGTGVWSVASNWTGNILPGAGDDVVITNVGATVLLTNATPALNSLLLNQILVLSNWDTSIDATTVIVTNGGVLALPPAFSNGVMSNRVHVLCTDFHLHQGGVIYASGKGFAGSTSGSGISNGPGVGLMTAGASAGSSHGGLGAALSNAVGGALYDAPYAPLLPGSGGGAPTAGSGTGGSGGGAVYIQATGHVRLDGDVLAQATVGSADAAGGSGGSIYIVCDTLEGTGQLNANGGAAGANMASGGGGGGLIAISYNSANQVALPKPALRMAALGGNGLGRGDPGIVSFPDDLLLTTNVLVQGRLDVPGWANVWTVPGDLIISNAWLTPGGYGFTLTVQGNLTVCDTGRLDVVSNGFLDVWGEVRLTNGGQVWLYSAATNGGATDYGAHMRVGGKTWVESNCWIVPVAHATDGGAPLFELGDLEIALNGGFDATGLGYAGGYVGGAQTNGFGPGGGLATTAGSSGGGHGGIGGASLSNAGGVAYGVADAPIEPGSGGASRSIMPFSVGKRGGGAIRIRAAGTLTLRGSLKADGEPVNGYFGGGGAGGGIFVACQSFDGTGGALSACGSAGATANDGGGGGGRIALWRAYDIGGATAYFVTGGVGYATGTLGSVVTGSLPDLIVAPFSYSNDVVQGTSTNLMLALWNDGLDTNDLYWTAISYDAWLTVGIMTGVLNADATNALPVSVSAASLPVGVTTGTLYLTATNPVTPFAPAPLERWLGVVVNVLPMAAPGSILAGDGAATDRIALTWGAEPGATGYEIWRGTSADTNAMTWLNSVGATTAYDDFSAQPGVLYYYWVRATVGVGWGAFSTADAGWRAMEAPLGLAASDGTLADRVAVVWNAVWGATGYEIWRHTTTDLNAATRVAGSVGTGYDDLGTAPGDVYYYWIKATNALQTTVSVADSGWRNWAMGTLAIDVTPDTAPWTMTAYAAGFTGPYAGIGDLAGVAAPAGDYTVRFDPLAGYTAPAATTVTVTAGAVTWVSGGYTALLTATDSDGDGYLDTEETSAGSDAQNADSYPRGDWSVGLTTSARHPRMALPFTATVDGGASALSAGAVFLVRGSNVWWIGDFADPGGNTQALTVRVWPGVTPATNYHVRVLSLTSTNRGESALFTLLAPVHGDYDRDGKTDLCLYYPPWGYWIGNRTSQGVWYRQFGWSATIPVPGDYDGDGRSDLAVYYASAGTWYILTWDNAFYAFVFGWSGATPLAADYDGDGYDDFAVYDAGVSPGMLYVLNRYGSWFSAPVGGPGDVPVAGDFDGDGLADPAAYNETLGRWAILYSAQGYAGGTLTWGGPGLRAMPDDYDGDGAVEAAVYELATGYWHFAEPYHGATRWLFGAEGALPVVGDFDGDGAADIGVYYGPLGTWYVWRSTDGYWSGPFGWEGVEPLF